MRPRTLLLLAAALAGNLVDAQEVQFNRDVRPILSRKCWLCHGPDQEQRQADLRLDLREQALAERTSGAAIVAGNASRSTLIQRVSSEDADERMPPADHGPRLAADEISVLKRWIDQGAHYEGHWSFLPISSPQPPPASAGELSRNPIDQFILQRLRQAGLRASPEAEKRTLLRRVHFDLIGLPPTPAEAAAFDQDQRSNAYEEVVDRLLQSPHYGERWGRHWLDQARYADSHGYTIDAERVMWPYRDWVIRALNDDLPFDQFTIEQLAGDLLPNATREQRIATGFHRNTLINQEGGVDAEQFRIEAAMDRVATTGSVWLGLTVGCAQCHSHKYDPISQREYYELFAFFNSCADVNNVGPTLDVHEGELFLPRDSADRAELNAALHRIERLAAERPARRAAWERSLASGAVGASSQLLQWQTLAIASARGEAARLTTLEDQSVLATPGIPREIYVVDTAPLPKGTKIGSFRLRFMPHDALPLRGPGLATNGNFMLSAVEVYLGEERLTLASAAADHAQQGFPVAFLLDDDPGTAWAINVESNSTAQMHVERTVVLTLSRPIEARERPLRFVLRQERSNDYNVGRVQFSAAEEVADILADRAFVEALAVSDAQRSEDQKKLIDSKFDATDAPLQEARQHLDEIRARLGLGTTVKTMVLQELDRPRTTHLLQRGDFLQPDKELGPLAAGVPAALTPLLPRTTGRPTDRLDLARWLVSADHPLTARVTVNRVWMHYFGRGLVETENDFGTQGSAPTHPELLDWLARSLVDDNWSLKSLHRLIVTSATYRQASHARSEAAALDPLNLLLARQNRLRLDAEIVRDAALQASGKLARKIGGPGVRPPQPDGVYAFTQNNKAWQTSTGEARYRRGMYTMFYRSAPYPTLTTFDAPDFQSACTRRQRSNTPLQALTMANDAAMYELAQELAARGLDEAPSPAPSTPEKPSDAASLEERGVCLIFERALGRPPSSSELGLVQSQWARSIAAGHDAKEAWTTLARAILNTDEFITRE